MKSIGKLSLLFSGFSLIVALGARYILGGWLPILYIFLFLFMAGIIFSIVWDYKFYLEFLSMKTTRDSLSLGWSLCFLIIFFTALGFLGLRFNKTFDLTEEGINSLAPQSQDILNTIDKDLTFLIFYNGDQISKGAKFIKNSLSGSLSLYRQESFKVKVRFVDSYVENALAEKYLSNLPDKTEKEIFIFVEYDGKKVRVDEPFMEESFTSAIIKAKKREKKEIYFLVGHGERDLQNDQVNGLKIFEQYLSDSAFVLKEWSFIQDGAPPSPPALILIVGPRRPFLQEEMDWLKNHLEAGGRLFMALDPGEKHNGKEFLKKFQINFQNNFIVSPLGYRYGGPAKAVGLFFDSSHSITKKFQGGGRNFAIFDRASAIDVSEEFPKDYKFSYLLKSHSSSSTVPKLAHNIKIGNLSQQNMAIEISGKAKKNSQETKSNEKKKEEKKERSRSKGRDSSSEDSEKSPSKKQKTKEKEKTFRLVVFGDSDFLTNKHFYHGINRDLALNTVVSLLDEEELISIRPKNPKKTEITLIQNYWLGLLTFFIVIPLAFIFASVLTWYKRREA